MLLERAVERHRFAEVLVDEPRPAMPNSATGDNDLHWYCSIALAFMNVFKHVYTEMNTGSERFAGIGASGRKELATACCRRPWCSLHNFWERR